MDKLRIHCFLLDTLTQQKGGLLGRIASNRRTGRPVCYTGWFGTDYSHAQPCGKMVRYFFQGPTSSLY